MEKPTAFAPPAGMWIRISAFVSFPPTPFSRPACFRRGAWPGCRPGECSRSSPGGSPGPSAGCSGAGRGAAGDRVRGADAAHVADQEVAEAISPPARRGAVIPVCGCSAIAGAAAAASPAQGHSRPRARRARFLAKSEQDSNVVLGAGQAPWSERDGEPESDRAVPGGLERRTTCAVCAGASGSPAFSR
jgi:hypothetical protein